ncbi:MAG: DNA-O6-methylguanine-protein-cysteine S-methyltransferase/DNA-3-methyladenine glycosylase Ada/AlkA [Pseudomonadota bacterium]
MVLDHNAAYLALKARDARFDGRLFVGVTSTGIYCRPVCRVRTPRFENCRFFATRERAEAATFRPCLKCRPEIAPGLSAMDSSTTLADAAARAIEHAVHAGEPLRLPALATRLGVTDRHLRRIFMAAHGVSPLAWLTTQRLLLAKQLLTDTAMPVTQVALASGFESLRRFNAAFAQHYRMQPTQLRRDKSAGTAAQGLRLAYRPPLDAEALFGFFARRQLEGVEQVDMARGLMRRTLAWPVGPGAVDEAGDTAAAARSGWIEVQLSPGRDELLLRTSDSLSPVRGAVMRRVRHAFDLDADPARIDPVLALLPLPPRPGLRLPGSLDAFETAVRVILGQQVTVKAARTLAARLVQRFGEPIDTPFESLTRLFPSPAAIAAASAEDIGTLGIVRQRVKALQALAQAWVEGRLRLDPGASVDDTLAALVALPGIGDWTAQVIAMRALAWPDAWPLADIGLMNALGTRDRAELLARAEPWRPWRAYAVMRLWQHIEVPT